MYVISRLFTYTFWTLMLFSLPVAAQQYQLKEILALPKAPDGVVIEIVTGNGEALRWALPESQLAVKQLRERFKDLPIAIVTHGNEQFALTKKNQLAHKKEHEAVQALMKENQVQVHVCGTHAEWRKLSAEDFPDYVDVSAAGPAQINDYKALGYLLLVIR